jgi:hypothetical protein
VLQRTRPVTYSLMAHEEAEIVRQHLCFKERDHVHTDGTQRARNRQAQQAWGVLGGEEMIVVSIYTSVNIMIDAPVFASPQS